MDAETLRREGTRALFKKDLEAYGSAIAQILREAYVCKRLGDPQTVLSYLDKLEQELRGLMTSWYGVMQDAKLDDNHPDPEPSKDGGNVGLDTLTQSELDDWVRGVFFLTKQLLVRE